MQHLAHLEKLPSGKIWLSKLPATVAAIAELWHLDIGKHFENGSTAFVAQARQNGNPVIIKLQWPHDEVQFEADALAVWNGNGAVKLLAHNAELHALLLEPCIPGCSLANSDEADKLGIIISLLKKLWVPATPPFKSLAAEATQWRINLSDKKAIANNVFDVPTIALAKEYLDELIPTQGEQVLVNQDFHGDNILSSQRDSWLAIDPKPLIGEREFAIASIVRSFELGHSRNAVLQRLDRLCDALNLNRTRALKWTVAQTVAWGNDVGSYDQHKQVVLWLVEDTNK